MTRRSDLHRVVVFGTTDAAVRAAERYMEDCPTVDVVWPRFSYAMQILGESEIVRLIEAKVQEHSLVQHLEDDPLVVVATGDEDLDAMIVQQAEERGLEVERAGEG